jgi:hemerythrin
MVFEWKQNYSVNVKEIDIQHKEILELMHFIYDSIMSKKSTDILNKALEVLAHHTKAHFLTEEMYFKEFKYEGAAEHIDAHNKLLRDIANFIEKIKQEKERERILEIFFDLIDFLENWLVDHLETLDKKYTKCFNDHGLY